MTEARGTWPDPWVHRLRRRIDTCDGPVVQIWGWPGSGKRLLLGRLLEAGGLEIPPSLLATPEALTAVAEQARRDRHPYLVCRKWPAPKASALDALPSSPLLVFTSRLCQPVDPDSASLVSPASLLLEEAEASDLWEATVGVQADPKDLAAALEATGGWYLPLRLIAEAVRDGKLQPGQAFTSLPELAAFLREVEERAGKDTPKGLAVLGFPLQPEALPPILRHVLSPWSQKEAPRRALGVTEDKGCFRACLLGEPRVWRIGQGSQETEVRWMLRRSLKIFAFLATNPERRAPRADLVAMAFSDEGTDVVRRNFHPTLSHLRRSLRADGSPLQPVRQRAGNYALAPEIEWDIDVDRFLAGARQLERLREEKDLEGAAQVGVATWSLYKGPFMEGEEDSWIMQRRENLHRIYLRLLRDLGGVYASLGRSQESLDAYRAVLLEDPLQETVQAAVMGIYASLGRRDLVRRQYDRLSKLLMSELGVEPLPETSFEYHRLMG